MAGRLVIGVDDALAVPPAVSMMQLAHVLLRWITPAGIVTSYEWDAVGRLLREERSGTSFTVEDCDRLSCVLLYDAAGRLLSTNDGERIRSFGMITLARRAPFGHC